MMEGWFSNREGFLQRIEGHVLMVRARSLPGLQRYISDHDIMPPYAVSDEDEHFQLSHPMTPDEREVYKWLYHRMKSLNKVEESVDTDPEPPYTPGPLVA